MSIWRYDIKSKSICSIRSVLFKAISVTNIMQQKGTDYWYKNTDQSLKYVEWSLTQEYIHYFHLYKVLEQMKFCLYGISESIFGRKTSFASGRRDCWKGGHRATLWDDGNGLYFWQTLCYINKHLSVLMKLLHLGCVHFIACIFSLRR